jgi:drug/metabolite transporter (DMT)-like permease
MGIYLVLVSLLASTVNALFSKKFYSNRKENDPISFTIALMFLVFVISSVVYFTLFFDKSDFQRLFSVNVLLTAVAEAVCIAISSVIYNNFIKKAPLSETKILFTFSGFVTMILSIFLGIGTLNVSNIIGGIFVILSIIVVSYRNERWKFNKVIFYIVLALVAYSIGTILDNKIILDYQLSPLFWVMMSYLMPAVIISITYPESALKIPGMLKKKGNLVLLLIASITSFVSYYFVYSSYNFGVNAAQANFILSSQNVIIVVLSIVFLKETRNILKVFLSAILSSVGIWLLS